MAIYRVRNDGPQDLDSVVIHRPVTDDRITYPIAVTGEDYAENGIELGPLALGQEARFTLCCGGAQQPPEFRVRVDTKAGQDSWADVSLLPAARGKPYSAP